MTTDMQTLIDQRPHLKDPFELYEKWLRFKNETTELLSKEISSSQDDSRAFPREIAGSVFTLFISIFDLPAKELDPLRRAMEAGDIDFMRLPLNDMPDLSLSYGEDELNTILFLLSKPYFLALQKTCSLENSQWENGCCPLCSAQSALASIAEGPQRLLHCSYCGTVGPYRFIGCPNCGTGDTEKLTTLIPEDEPGFRISTCDACHTYVKIVEGSVLDEMTVDQADIASLPLDIVAQKKGYSRKAPNPIGLKTIK